MRGKFASILILYNLLFLVQPVFHSAIYHKMSLSSDFSCKADRTENSSSQISAKSLSSIHSACLFHKTNSNLLDAAFLYSREHKYIYVSENLITKKSFLARHIHYFLPSPRSPPFV